eukprot:729618-Pleurochrysis_carterae.AAC.1
MAHAYCAISYFTRSICRLAPALTTLASRLRAPSRGAVRACARVRFAQRASPCTSLAYPTSKGRLVRVPQASPLTRPRPFDTRLSQFEAERRRLVERRAASVIQAAARRLRASREHQCSLLAAAQAAADKAAQVAAAENAVRRLVHGAAPVATVPSITLGGTDLSAPARKPLDDDALTDLVLEMVVGKPARAAAEAERTSEPQVGSHVGLPSGAVGDVGVGAASSSGVWPTPQRLLESEQARAEAEKRRQQAVLSLEHDRIEATRALLAAEQQRVQLQQATEMERAAERLRAAKEKEELHLGLEAVRSMGEQIASSLATQLGAALRQSVREARPRQWRPRVSTHAALPPQMPPVREEQAATSAEGSRRKHLSRSKKSRATNMRSIG